MTIPNWPRMMRRTTAARYCDLAPAKFLAEVASGRLPPSIKLGGEEHWDREAIDDNLNRLGGRTHDWRKEQPGLAA